ncbi:MAG: 4-alpha-glucanotransferase [Chloroflexaceae bacterium]|nr:4-alpha-glucanotransferase [Chloroflexaceae bacterium]NJO04844.1 4-alpha-glucanotransferase [Chloroflexaceae bacterium]
MRTGFPRASGILLHPTSFPGFWGIGDLGAAAYEFIDFLHDGGQRLWQILPLVPTGLGNSPYQSPSAFAGNPLLISPDRLLQDGLLKRNDLYQTDGQPVRHFSPDRVAYDAAAEFKMPLLNRAFERFQQGHGRPHHTPETLAAFRHEHSAWLEDYTLFMAIREHLNDAPLDQWSHDIRTRNPEVIAQLRRDLAERIEFRTFVQYLFFGQWSELKAYANKCDVKIIGDAPIFVAYDSADVWANPDLFYLDDEGRPTVVAGVPPDYFSEDGQLWGNPLYRWDRMAERGYVWWTQRLTHTLKMVDILRLDHFRGFEAYWEIQADETTAKNGKWVQGPGAALFRVVKRELGDLRIIAEDLGLITPEVRALRDKFDMPGMKILQFAFGDNAHNPYLPHNYLSNSVVYTGTHDNNTTVGWFTELTEAQRERVRGYLGHDAHDIAWDLIRLAYASVANMVVVPLQDVLRLGSEARQNVPGVMGDGNWTWRYQAGVLEPGVAKGLHFFTRMYGRDWTERTGYEN